MLVSKRVIPPPLPPAGKILEKDQNETFRDEQTLKMTDKIF